MKACLFGILWPLVLPSHADGQFNTLAGSLTKLTNQTLSDSGRPAWLKRTQVKFGVADRQPTWMIKTVQPLRQTRSEAVFVQGRLWQDEGNTVSNIGSGYRWLAADDTWILGLNGFYDQDVQSSTERISIGGEVFRGNASMRANLYSAIGSHAATPSQALDGFDLKLEMPTPFLRHTRLSVKTYQWSVPERTEPVLGWSTALKTKPHEKLSVALGASRSTHEETAFFMNLTYHFGNPGKRQPTALDRLAPQRTHIVREHKLLAGNG